MKKDMIEFENPALCPKCKKPKACHIRRYQEYDICKGCKFKYTVWWCGGKLYYQQLNWEKKHAN